MKKLRFDKELGHLVDEEDEIYKGRRFDMASGHSTPGGNSSFISAENEALSLLLSVAEKKGADAYEIIDSSIHDTRQEYDPQPYSAIVRAILYRNEAD